MGVSIPRNEAARLAALYHYDILDTPAEAAFDRITRLAARLLDVPIAQVSLTDRDRQWLKSSYGLAATEVPRSLSFCAHAILTDDIMVVPDATQDERFHTNPFVFGDPGVRFYAGAPLLTPDGFALGTLCAVDTQPRTLSAKEATILADLAALVMDELELRRAALDIVTTAATALDQSERRYRQAFEHNQAVKLIVDPHSGAIVDANAAAAAFYGYSRARLLQLHVCDINVNALPPAAYDAKLRAALTAGVGAVESQHRLASGELRDVEVYVSTITVDQQPLLFAIIHDITDRKWAEKERRQQQCFLQALLDKIDTGIVACSNDGILTLFNRAAEQMHGLPQEALPADQWSERYDLYQADGVTRLATADIPLMRALKGESVRNVEMVIAPKQAPARTVVAHGTPIIDTTGEQLGAVVAMHDITERKQAEAELIRQAFHDSLTGLPNRTLLLDRLEQALTRTRHDAHGVAVLFIDLDHFKELNDTRGHAAGDSLLQQLAQRLLASVRPEDTVARFGGDEFVVVLEDVAGAGEAIVLAQRLLTVLQQPLLLADQAVALSASIGIASSVEEPVVAAELLRRADMALRQAKAAGRGGVAGFDPGMDAAATAAWELSQDLRHAVARQELRVLYQPVVDLRTDTIVGMEALVRWQHPWRGLIPPATFIPLAEASGLIVPIGRWVLAEACQQAVVWQALRPEAPLVMSVNLSACELAQPALVEHVSAVLRRTGLAAGCLKLEVTESAVMHDVAAASAQLAALKSLGVQLALDDFGTGYSSLSYLQQFPLDTLKVDRSFVQRLPDDTDTVAIVQAITMLAHALGMNVTAEGMETEAEVAQVRAVQCDTAQGYWFGRPLPAMELTALLRQGARARVA